MEKIEHVSDTALMVAACRAIENDRPDGLVRDPFAAALAGEKGAAIVRNAPGMQWICFGIAVRSHVIDAFIARAINEGVRTVLNLGAGLDTRPWRMDLPPSLRWIEVDFEPMLDYKSGRLAMHEPRCVLERIAADVSKAAHRARVFHAAGPDPALMITEGLLMYLPRAAVTALATEPLAPTGIRRWILDVTALGLMRAAHGETLDSIHSVRAEDHLEGGAVLDAVMAARWTVAEFTSYRDSASIAPNRVRQILESGAPRPERAPDNDASGIYLLQHNGA